MVEIHMMPACLPTCLPFCLLNLPTNLPACLLTYLSTCLTACLPTCLPVSPSACQIVCLSAACLPFLINVGISIPRVLLPSVRSCLIYHQKLFRLLYLLRRKVTVFCCQQVLFHLFLLQASGKFQASRVMIVNIQNKEGDSTNRVFPVFRKAIND